MTTKPIEEVLKQYTQELMSIQGVVGTAEGLCNGNPCIKVYVLKRTPDQERKIPGNIEGYPTMIEETEEIKTLPKKH